MKQKKFTLNVATRLVLLMNLPEQGSVTEMINKRNVRKKIDFSSEEMAELGMKEDNGKIVWNPDNGMIDVCFTEEETKFLKDVVTKISDSKKINDSILDFAEEILKEE